MNQKQLEEILPGLTGANRSAHEITGMDRGFLVQVHLGGGDITMKIPAASKRADFERNFLNYLRPLANDSKRIVKASYEQGCVTLQIKGSMLHKQLVSNINETESEIVGQLIDMGAVCKMS